MKKKTLKTIVLVVLANLLFFGVVGTCFYFVPFGDGGIGVHGKVYEWADVPPGATSKIHIISYDGYDESNEVIALENIIAGISENVSVIPIKEVTVSLGRREDIERWGWGDYVFKVNSDDDGKFEGGWTIAPTREEFLVKISKPGYTEAIGELENGGGAFAHAIVAVLVPENSAD